MRASAKKTGFSTQFSIFFWGLCELVEQQGEVRDAGTVHNHRGAATSAETASLEAQDAADASEGPPPPPAPEVPPAAPPPPPADQTATASDSAMDPPPPAPMSDEDQDDESVPEVPGTTI